MNFSEAARTGRAIKLMRYDEDQKKLVEKTNWLELQPNGFLLEVETGKEYYPSQQEYLSDNWMVEEETVKVTARHLIEVFKGYMYGAIKKELVTIVDGISPHDLAEEFVRKLDFKELSEVTKTEKEHEF